MGIKIKCTQIKHNIKELRKFYVKTLTGNHGREGKLYYNSQVKKITVCRRCVWIEIEICFLGSRSYRSPRDP